MIMPRRRAFFDLLIRHRWGVLAAYAVLLAASALGITRLRVDYSAEQFFLFDGPERATFDAFKGHFPREDLQLSAFLEVEGEFTGPDFQRLASVAEAFRDAGLESVRWLGSVELVEEGLEDGVEVVSFLRLEDETPLDDLRLQALVKARADDPVWTGLLWGPEQRVFAVHGFLAPDENTDARRREVTGTLQARLAELTPERGRLLLNGLPVLRVTVPLALASDMGRLLGLGILLALGLVWLYFRRVGLALLTLAGVVPAVLLTLGGLGLAGGTVSVLTSSTPIVVLVVGISDAIHLMVGARRHRRRGQPTPAAVVEAFTHLSRACFFTSLTTALGFVGLVATRIPIVAEFGLVTAAAVMATWAVSMTLLPVLVSFARDLGPDSTWLSRRCDGFARSARRTLDLPTGPVLAAFALVLAGGVALGATLEVQAYLIDDLREGDPILEELRWIEDAGFGVFQVNVFVDHEHGVGHSPEALRWAEDFVDFAVADPLVLKGAALPAVVRKLGYAAGLPAEPRGPFTPEAGTDRWSARTVRELLFLAELQGDDAVEDLYLLEEGVSQIVLSVRDGGSSATRRLLDRLETRLDAVPPPSGRATLTGTVKLSQLLWDELLGRFLPGVGLSVLLIWLSLSWMFRSARVGLLSLLPNLFPLAVLAGLLAVGGFDLKPSSALVFSMVFGIVADDTIHMLSALADDGWRRGSPGRRLTRIFDDVGPALVLSTVVVCGGFGVLMASRFEALFLIGLLTSLAALLALGADLVGLPHLFRAAGLVGSVESPPPRSPS